MILAAFEPEEFECLSADGTLLCGEVQGDGQEIILCHGLSASRRYVVHGSKHLPRRGYRLVTYDARGHGRSEPDAPYGYEGLAADLESVIENSTDARSGDGLILGGHSMGCHTVTRRAIHNPEGIAALILIGPVFSGVTDDDSRWDRRAHALESGGPEAFAEVVAENSATEEIREKTFRLARDRARLHQYPEAVAQALREVPRSRPFDEFDDLAGIDLPTLIVASHDESDPGHPWEVAVRWAETIPGAELVSEEPGQAPLAWQGGLLSREIESFLGRHGISGERQG